MNHDPKEHFSEAQVEVITSIFHDEINKMLVKTIGAYVVTVGLGVMAIGAGWYRLGHLEEGVASITANVYSALPSKEYVDTRDQNMQNQLDEMNKRFDRFEAKIDVIMDRI